MSPMMGAGILTNATEDRQAGPRLPGLKRINWTWVGLGALALLSLFWLTKKKRKGK